MLKSTINNNTLVVESITNAINTVANITKDEISNITVNSNEVTIITVDKESIKSLFTLYIFSIRMQTIQFKSTKEYAHNFIKKFGASILK